MIDFGLDKIALIAAVALVVIGPEKLPRVTRTVGHLLGRARRYVADVQAEVSRSMELDEIQRMKQQLDQTGQSVSQTLNEGWSQAQTSLEGAWGENTLGTDAHAEGGDAPPHYRHPRKNWRLKRGALPQWYKRREGLRGHAQSGAARVARFRPRLQRP
jgi:sec-independent protein translocase protein TatB